MDVSPAQEKRIQAKRKKFLAALAQGDSVAGACRASGIARRTAYRWRVGDDDFLEAWEDAIDEGTDLLEDEARRRAVEGVEQPVMYQGKQVATVRKHSDPLLIFLLKGRRPEVFGEGGGRQRRPPVTLAQLLRDANAKLRGRPDHH